MNHSGKVALVTGGGRRVGRVIATSLAKAGMRVAIHYRASEEEATAAMEHILAAGGEAAVFGADLGNETELSALVPRVLDRFGSLEVLVNNASIYRRGTLRETTRADWDENMGLHVWAPLRLAQDMASHLQNRSGKIISLNDARSVRPARFAYGISKVALSGLTRSLALALAPNIQANEIAIGAVLLPAGVPDEYESVLAARTPARRMGTPEEVASLVMWLINNDYVTGNRIYLDGGGQLLNS